MRTQAQDAKLPERARAVFADEPGDIVNGVLVYAEGPTYARNFGKQWTRFRNVQIDSVSGTRISRDFLLSLLGQPLESLRGKTVLEVGCGAGRFTEHLTRHAELVVAVDLSDAIFVNVANGAENLVLAKANLLDMPALAKKFDVVFCRGVIQHTPDPAGAIASLHQWVSADGVVVFDVYARGRLGPLEAKYIWRKVIPGLMSYESFERFLDRHAASLLRLRWKLKPMLPGKTKRLLDYVLPVWDYRNVLPLDDDALIEWGKLDTLDAMFAKYDTPMKHDEVIAILARMPVDVIYSDRNNFFRTRLK